MIQISRFTRFLSLAVLIAVLVAAALVIPGWVPLLPRAVRRGMTESLLRTVLIGYSGIALTAVLGTPLAAWQLARSIRERRSRRWQGRALVIGLCCLITLIMLELGSAAIRAYLHRLPRLPTTFEQSLPDEYRIVVLGGSSALGEPYRPWLSVGQIVAWQLQEVLPDRRIECEILAWLGESLEMQHQKLAKLKRRPDAIIIYSGHNEFAARFEEERDSWIEEEPRTWILRRVYHASLASPFCRIVYETISKNRLDSPSSLSGRHHLVDPPLCSPSETEEIVADFRRRLETIAAYTEQIGALPILIVPPANEAGFEPSRSTLPTGVSASDRQRLINDFERARLEESTDPDRSDARYIAILRRFPDFAEAHFRLARSYERRGRRAEAADHYLSALDKDGLPIRCTQRFREIYTEVAIRHPGAILIDGRQELIAISSTGLIGDEVIQDTHHPTLRGFVALASAVLRELRNRRVLGQLSHMAVPLDRAACATHFGLDQEKWATVCDRTSVHYERVAGYRFDPTERLRKSVEYAEAARKIRAGAAPGNVGIAGIRSATLTEMSVIPRTPAAASETKSSR